MDRSEEKKMDQNYAKPSANSVFTQNHEKQKKSFKEEGGTGNVPWKAQPQVNVNGKTPPRINKTVSTNLKTNAF